MVQEYVVMNTRLRPDRSWPSRGIIIVADAPYKAELLLQTSYASCITDINSYEIAKVNKVLPSYRHLSLTNRGEINLNAGSLV